MYRVCVAVQKAGPDADRPRALGLNSEGAYGAAAW